MTLADFNKMTSSSAEDVLLCCCHCKSWAQEVSQTRPYDSLDDLISRADYVWGKANEAQILEAFSGHARIGDIDALRDKYSKASMEQGQVKAADETVLRSLMQMNDQYLAKNGFIFIVCASGKSAAEMADILKTRLPNSREQELRTGADEQAKITSLRLQKLFPGNPI